MHRIHSFSAPKRCVWLTVILWFSAPSITFLVFQNHVFFFLTMCLRQGPYSLGNSYPRIWTFICQFFHHSYFFFIDLFCCFVIFRDAILLPYSEEDSSNVEQKKAIFPLFLRCWLEKIMFPRQKQSLFSLPDFSHWEYLLAIYYSTTSIKNMEI